MQETSEEG